MCDVLVGLVVIGGRGYELGFLFELLAHDAGTAAELGDDIMGSRARGWG